VNDVQREEPEWMRQMRQRMKSRVKLNITDNNLAEIMQRIQEQTGLNYQIDPNLDMDELVVADLQLNDPVPTDSALNMILGGLPSDSPLIYQFRDGLIFITTKENQNAFIRPKGKLYDVTDLVTSFGDDTLDAAGLLTGGALDGLDEEEDSTEPLSTATLIEIIQEAIEPESWDGNGVNITEYEEGKIMISQATEIHEKIQDLLEMFRKQQKLQVSIETRFITSQDDDLFDIGVDWKGLDEVPLEDSGGEVGSGVYSKRTNTNSDTRVASLLGSAADDAVGGAPLFINDNRATEGLNFELSVLDPIRAGIALHALDRKQKQKDLLRPRLTVLNNKQGYILNSVETSYVREYESEEGYVTPEVSKVSSGELLVVRPTVSSDRRYITLELSPQITRLIEFEERLLDLPVRQNNNGGGGNGAQQTNIVQVTVELPRLLVWQVQTRIQVPDGGVVFVGGRMGNIERKVSRGVPILSKVPLLGRLFRSDGEYVQLDNLIISVRAKILVFDELENQLN
jgi:general secretion pathway protein D